jgi:ABC-type oligopeptide transport system substrate-binding subunit
LQTNAPWFLTGQHLNVTGISNGRLDVIFNSLSRGTLPTLQVKKEIQEILIEQSPIIPIFYRQTYSALNSSFFAHLENIRKDPWELYYLARPGDRPPLK